MREYRYPHIGQVLDFILQSILSSTFSFAKSRLCPYFLGKKPGLPEQSEGGYFINSFLNASYSFQRLPLSLTL